MADDLEKRITAKYVLDSTGFNNSLKGINSQLVNNKAQLNLASEGLKAYGATSEKLKGVQQALAQQLELHNKKVDVWKSSIEKTTVKMQENIKERERLKQSLQEAGKKHAEIVNQYGKESEEAQKSKTSLKALGEEYKNKGKQIESNAKQIEHYNMQQTKSQAELTKTQGALSRVNKELAESNNKWLSASESLKKSSEGLKNAGAKISSVGDGILKATAPLVAFGVAGSKMSMDFGDSMAQISTISDDTQVPIGQLREQVLKLSNDSGIAVDGLSTSIYDALSAGQQTGDVMNFVEKNTRLAKGGFADIGSTIDLTTSILNAYKMSSEEVADVSDILIQVQNKGKTTVKELSADMGKVIPTAVATNTNLRQVGTSYALMTANGIKTAESTTYVNSLLNELSKTGTDADKALRQVAKKSFSDLMKDGKSLGDVLQILDGHAKKNKLSLKDMFGSAEAGKAALVLSTNAGKDFEDMLKDMNNTAGMTDDAFNKVSNTAGAKFRKNLNRLKNEGIRLGDALAPLLDKGIDLVSKVTDKISGLSEEQLQNYAKWTMMAMGIGGFLKVAGGAVTGIGNVVGAVGTLSKVLGTATVATEGMAGTTALAGGGLAAIGSIALPVTAVVAGLAAVIYAYNKNTEYMAEASNKSTQDMGAMETAMAGLKGNIVHTNKELADMSVKYKEWSKEVSPEAQKSLEDISNKITNYNLELAHASKLDTLADEETGARLNARLDQICNSAIEKIKSRSPEVQNTLKESFATDGVIDEEEQKILDSLNKSGDEQIQKIEETKSKILELEQRASTETGEVRQQTLQEVDKLTQEIGNIEMQNTVNSKQELLAAQADFNARMKSLDMQGMANLLQEKAKARDEETQKINKKYDTEIEMLKLNIANVDEETKVAYQNKITQLEDQKTKEISVENEKYKGFLDTAIEKNGQIINYIDMHNGTMLSKAEGQKQFELNNYLSKMDNMLDITKTGYYKIKDSATGEMHDIYVEVDESTGKIVGTWDTATEEIFGNPVKTREEIDEDLKNGVAFEPVTNSWDTKKHEIWENAVEVQSKSDYGLFDWVADAYAGMQSWLNKHPFVSGIAKGAGFNIGQKWTGTNYFEGGLTYLHDSPGKNANYELYDLPRGTRIFNHDASQDLVLKTAESVAEKVASSVLHEFQGIGSNNKQVIIIPVQLDGHEIARVITPHTDKIQGSNIKLAERGMV